MIDIHTHIGRAGKSRTASLSAEELVLQMNAWGVDKAVVLPLHDSPSGWYLATTEYVLAECNRFPNRLVPFCQIDPRFGDNSAKTDFTDLLAEYKERGCRGVGEITANMPFDNPLVWNLMRHCGAAKLPVLFHAAHCVGGTYGLVDDLGLPKLDAMLAAIPETTFIAHGPAFWGEMSANVTDRERGGYPKGPVVAPGKTEALLAKHSNLYADLSAGSGYNAITRDPKYGFEFLDRFQDKLLFGTDFLGRGQQVEIVEFLRQSLAEGVLSAAAHRKIMHDNAAKLLRYG